jgi:DNA recombination protein RmuC
LCAAEEDNPQLTEFAMELRVLIATPTTLIALLKSIAFCWRQENLARNAKDISDLGQELYRRCSGLGEHFAKVGNHLAKATESYNKAVGSLETRVLVTARKFGDFGAGSTGVEIEEIDPLEITPRILQAPEFVGASVDDELPRLRAPK